MQLQPSLWLVGPEARRTLWTPPGAEDVMFGYRIAEADEVGQCEKLTVMGLWVGGQRRNMIFWKHVDIGDDIFSGDILEIIYVLGGDIFEITVYFLGDLFSACFWGQFFHLSLGSTPPTHPVGFVSLTFKASFVWGLLKFADVSLRKVGRTFHFCKIRKAFIYLSVRLTPQHHRLWHLLLFLRG